MRSQKLRRDERGCVADSAMCNTALRQIGTRASGVWALLGAGRAIGVDAIEPLLEARIVTERIEARVHTDVEQSR